ncbi:MAG: sirohydrochlorin cobaltochelatase [Anaerovoracaceae bacterium]
MSSKKEILVVIFGTSHQDTREYTIEAIEQEIQRNFGEMEVRRAFTSGMIMEVLKKRDNLHIDTVDEALGKLAAEGYKKVFLQPTHIINGDEYEKIVNQVRRHECDFWDIKIGAPLLTASADYDQVCHGLMKEVSLKEDEVLLLMGHGTGHFADSAYAALDYRFKALGYENVFVGTVEGYPELDTVLPLLAARSPKKVILLPLMVVAGDHAKNDMAGEEDSWKTILEEQGYAVDCILKGLGEFPSIRELYVAHIKEEMYK